MATRTSRSQARMAAAIERPKGSSVSIAAGHGTVRAYSVCNESEWDSQDCGERDSQGGGESDSSWPLGGGQHEWDDLIRKTCVVGLLRRLRMGRRELQPPRSLR